MAKRTPSPAPDVWTYRDEVLVATAHIVAATATGELDRLPRLASNLALSYDDEQLVAVGDYRLDWWGANGDGTWSHAGGFAAGTGPIGIGLAVGSLIGNSVGRARARAEAADAAMIRWRPVDAGQVHITTHGLYLTGGRHGYRRFLWDHLQQADVVVPCVLQFSASTDHGNQTWRLYSDWAELLFAYWALARNRNHPQWITGTWYPSDIMRQRAAYHRKDLAAIPPA